MPTTTPDGLPYETLDDGEPTRTLNGGRSGTADILAIKAQEALTDIRVTAESAADAAARGWVPIGSGEETGNFAVDFTGGGEFPLRHFSMIRIYFRGSLDDVNYLNFRINNDATTDMHRRNWILWAASSGNVVDNGADDATSWRAGQFSPNFGCNTIVTLFNTHQHTRLSYQADGFRPASGTTVRQFFKGGGDLADERSAEFVQVFPASGSISQMWWYAEGFRP